MNQIMFANESPNPGQRDELMAWVLDSVRVPMWALVDTALLPHTRITSLARQANVPLINAFSQSDLKAFGDSAPHMMRLPADGGAAGDLVQALLKQAGSATAVSLMKCSAIQSELLDLFSYLGKTSIEARRTPIHCRFADTRVLASLLPVLTTKQRQRVGAVVAQWCWTGRQGEPVVWMADAVGAGNVDDRATLRLSIEQFRAMQRMAEPDLIFAMLAQKTPEIVPDHGRGGFHATLQRILRTADGLEVKQPRDRLQFVVLALTCGEDFYLLPELQEVWHNVAKYDESLLDLMQNWSDDLWQRLETRNTNAGAAGPSQAGGPSLQGSAKALPPIRSAADDLPSPPASPTQGDTP